MIKYLKNIVQTKRELIFQFIKFGMVGVLGTLIDFGALNLLHQYFGVFVYGAATISFILAVINNFLLNKYWTFRNDQGYRSRGHIQFIQFVFVSIIGLLINLGIMYLLIEYFAVWYNWAKLAAVIVVLFWNFIANKLWTFRVNKQG